MKFQCEDCGDKFSHGEELEEDYSCVVCGGDVVNQTKAQTVPKEELEELVKMWRGSAGAQARGGSKGQSIALANCADELEGLIEQ